MHLRVLACYLLPALAMVTPAAWVKGDDTSTLERQRELFISVHGTAERGDWSTVDGLADTDRQLLERYVLWPDLRAAYLRATLDKTSLEETAAFLDQHGSLRPARELRYRLALQLARSGDLDVYLDLYERFYQGQQIAKLDCLALQAEIEAGRHARVAARAKDLWLVGKSQVRECDPVFEYLDDQQLLGAVDYLKRFELAVEAREFELARWLAKKIDAQHLEVARHWIVARDAPERFLNSHATRADGDTAHKQLVYAAERLTYGDPVLANAAWERVSNAHRFTEEQRLLTARHIALWTARDNLPDAHKLLSALPAAAQNDEVTRWRARTSLRNGNWHKLLLDIAAMPDEQRAGEEWRYWRAVALQRSGQVLAANAGFRDLATERSYYGFLAADEVGLDYALEDAQFDEDEAVIAGLAARPDMVRARELFHVGQESRGRSEWNAAVRHLTPDEKRQAAILANRWGWHSRAISAAASLGEYDDLSLRYPLAYRALFEQSSNQAQISSTWAYGIARSESLFMRDVRSRAGAIGLMQLMPATGREVAKNLRLPYHGVVTLTNPESNIRLGTSYLGRMAERYNGNPVLATAAYNAGPHRVDRWLPESGAVDARIWIENIPFNETRAYVKRVLSAQAIFHWRMTGQVQRVSDTLLNVEAIPAIQRLAAR